MPEIKKVKGRVMTYVKDLDERMEGGIPQGYVVCMWDSRLNEIVFYV